MLPEDFLCRESHLGLSPESLATLDAYIQMHEITLKLWVACVHRGPLVLVIAAQKEKSGIHLVLESITYIAYEAWLSINGQLQLIEVQRRDTDSVVEGQGYSLYEALADAWAKFARSVDSRDLDYYLMKGRLSVTLA